MSTYEVIDETRMMVAVRLERERRKSQVCEADNCHTTLSAGDVGVTLTCLGSSRKERLCLDCGVAYAWIRPSPSEGRDA